jgi:hypothetical protein
MITKKQYIRLTIVLSIPLLALGSWLAANKIIFSSHSVILCDEFDSHISCFSISATEESANNLLYENDAVRLWGARLEGGFHHPVVIRGHSEIKSIDGEAQAPPVDGGRKILSLPPKSIGNRVSIWNRVFSSCEIAPLLDDDKNWGYSCRGDVGDPDFSPDNFYFQSEDTNKKFQEAIKIIAKHRLENESMEIRALIASLLTPIVSYLLLSAVIFLLVKTSKYVIYGRRSGAA